MEKVEFLDFELIFCCYGIYFQTTQKNLQFDLSEEKETCTQTDMRDLFYRHQLQTRNLIKVSH